MDSQDDHWIFIRSLKDRGNGYTLLHYDMLYIMVIIFFIIIHGIHSHDDSSCIIRDGPGWVRNFGHLWKTPSENQTQQVEIP